MRSILVFASIATTLMAQSMTDSPSGKRITPPTISSVSPQGIARGATVEVTVEGFNLAKTSAVYTSQPGIQARIVRIKELPDSADVRLGSNGTRSSIDLGPLPPRNQVTLEFDVSPDAEIGPVNFRLVTPLGASPEGRFLVEPYFGESPDREPNDTPETAFETYLPTILVGTIAKPGDVDYYKIEVKAGDELVFENAALMLGSPLKPVIGIYAADQSLLREFGEDGGRDSSAFAYRFEKAGTHYIRVSDYQEGGSTGHFYRIKAGKLPVAISAYPLGVQRGKSAQIALKGFNLTKQVQVEGKPSPEDEQAILIRPQGPAGQAFNRVKLALGDAPEAASPGTNSSLSAAQSITAPVVVNGKLQAKENYFRFRAKKGERLTLEVAANRLGSPLDSILEILDAAGKPVERATVRCVLQTSTTLRDHDSAQPGIRILSATGFAVGDYAMIGSEIVQFEAMPRGPDDDARFVSFGGQRMAMLDTTSEAHANDSPIYKVQIHPPGAQFASNGLPLVHLPYRNDDGGPGFGKDSRLRFTAPADGEYIVKLRDVRGLSGEDYAYRLELHPPEPDFRLTVTPRNPNVPVGGRIPLTVTALRMDDFDGAVEVSVEGLPAGLHATRGVIPPGQVSTTLLLSADESAKLKGAAPLKVSGQARIGAKTVAHEANPGDPLKLISLAPKPDVQMTAETRQVEIEPGGKVQVTVSIKRNNEFGGRVPVEVRNLPPGVLVTDVGLNGVLLNEDENRRSFTLEALPGAMPIEQPIYVSGNVETRAAGQQNTFAGEPIMLTVKKRSAVSGEHSAASSAGSADR
ncbi:MAG TPA: PPC domain-containing protein [Bryobacteraceae bacterium]|nr:PPC domain-containing protein [Bryobacteraceae bacterium]